MINVSSRTGPACVLAGGEGGGSTIWTSSVARRDVGNSPALREEGGGRPAMQSTREALLDAGPPELALPGAEN
jgi:hypothetical protein